MRKLIVIILFLLTINISCQRRQIERRIDGIWETVFYRLVRPRSWFDSNHFMDGHLYFSSDKYQCTVPRDSRENLSDSYLELNTGSWNIIKHDTSWMLYITTKSGKLTGSYYVTFLKDTVYNPYSNNNELAYLMLLRNQEWNILCRKVGIIDEKW